LHICGSSGVELLEIDDMGKIMRSETRERHKTQNIWLQDEREESRGSNAGDQEQVKWLAVQMDPLSSAKDDIEYHTHLAAVEWALDPSILIHSAEDILARTHWQELLEPYEHQVKNLITFCRRAPVALIADDVGLGKTISAGLILSELRIRGVVNRCLILAPKLLGPQWEEELREKFRIRGECAAGAALGAAARKGADVVISTYHSARTRIKELSAADFDMLILDEAHHMRNLHGTAKPPKMAVELQKALAERSFKYVLMLTATPIQNRLWDLYSLVDLLSSAKGHRNPLGTNNEFVSRYVNDGKSSARVLNMGRQEEFRRHLSQYMVRTRRADCGLEFPARSVKMVRAEQSSAERELFKVVVEAIQGMNALNKVSVAQAFMSSPHALLKQLENMSQKGSSHVDYSVVRSVKQIVNSLKHTGKERQLISLLKKLRAEKPEDWRVVLFTGRKETQQRLGRIISEEFGSGLCGFIQGGQAVANNCTVKNYSCSPPNVNIIVSTDAGAEGVNLQKGNVVVNYDLPWNPMIVEQRIGRVQRLGSVHASVIVLNLVLKDSVEEHVVGRLQEKLTAISATLGDIEGVLESMGNNDDESFETTIRKLVLASLAGRDVDAAVKKQLASIENAKALYEEEQMQVDRQLGQLDAMHHEGPRMPQLATVKPRLTEKDFVLRALERSEGTLTKDRDLFRYSRAGYAPEIVCFDTQTQRGLPRDPGIAGGPKVGLYRSGQPAYERLVSEWSRKGNSLVRDVRLVDDVCIEEIICRWGEELNLSVEVEKVKVRSSEERFAGKFAARTAAMVAHDKYEKLVDICAHNANDPVPPESIIAAAPVIEGGVLV
jgi:SNF2 family DNA or RNA helicase